MAAATANRKATRLGDAKFSYVDARTIVDGEIIYAGTMVEADDTSGEVGAATDASGKGVLGVSTQYVDNTDDGETLSFISTAIHQMDNDGTVEAVDIGALCYVLDDQTVSMDGAGSEENPAGIVVEVTTDGVYVDFDPAKKV